MHSRLDYGNFILVEVRSPAYRLRYLQSVLNAAARLTYCLGRYDHITDALVSLYWLRVPERVDYKLAVQSYRVLHGAAPNYLNVLRRTADLVSRQRLRSSASERLEVPTYKLSTVGRRSFAVAAPLFWNTLPLDAQTAPSLPVFRARLKTFLFRMLFFNLHFHLFFWFCYRGLRNGNCYYSHVKKFLIIIIIIIIIIHVHNFCVTRYTFCYQPFIVWIQ